MTMLTTLLLAATLATAPAPTGETVAELHAPDWSAEFSTPPRRDAGQDAPSAEDIRRAATALVAEMAADAVLDTRAGQRLVLSALVCEATQLLVAPGHVTRAARARLRSQADSAQLRLDVLALQPLSCDAYPVERIVQCLGILPAAECTENDELAAQVLAAERLASVTP